MGGAAGNMFDPQRGRHRPQGRPRP
jgi:hypothetical protein